MTPRSVLISELRTRLARDGFPRLTVLVMLTLAAGVAFLGSVIMLASGVHSMGVRYGLAVIAGYVAFLGLMRVWIALRRGVSPPDLNPFDVDFTDAMSAPRGSEVRHVFAGGSTGGGGGGSAWAPAHGTADAGGDRVALGTTQEQEGHSFFGRAAHRIGDAFDVDEFAWLILALAAALGGVVCVFYVLYIAPLLLAEVALDAALVSAVYRQLRKEDVGHWTGAVVRRTWKPTVALLIFMFVVGFASQRAVPEARSIGAVIRALAS